MHALIIYASLIRLIPNTMAIRIPGLSPIIGDLINTNKSQPGVPQTPELLAGSPYCVQAYEVHPGDTCFSIAQQHGLATGQITHWSPVIRQHGCDALPVGGRICVATANEPEPLKWTVEKQTKAEEESRKKKEEEEKRNKQEEEETKKKKEDEERKRKEEEDRKNREEEEKKNKADRLKKKIPMWRDGKVRWPEPREGQSYPIVFYGRGEAIGNSITAYCQHTADGPDMIRQPKYLTDYCDDRCTFWSWEEMEPMGERFQPKNWLDRVMGRP